MPHSNGTTPPLAETYDLVVIGGGINGVGIAADAAGRGLSVFLCEKDDLASHTSSASSKLIHGGLRYLEHKEFRLVREAPGRARSATGQGAAYRQAHALYPPTPPALAPGVDDSCGSVPLRSLGQAGKTARVAQLEVWPRQPAGKVKSPGASNTPIAGSTTRAWWCLTPWLPANRVPMCIPRPVV